MEQMNKNSEFKKPAKKRLRYILSWGLLIVFCLGSVCYGVFFFAAITYPEEVRGFMATRIENCGNTDIVISFLGHIDEYAVPEVLTWRNVPWKALLPAFMLSELKNSMLIIFGAPNNIAQCVVPHF
jgi:hypothetical protein